jgi:hypothetical protein
VLLPSPAAGGTIVATAAVFDYEDGAPFVELSDTLVAESFGGYGLQKRLFRLRVASVIVTQGTDVAITTAVMPENGDSVANIQKAGFLPWGSPIPSAHASCPACPHQPRAGSLSRPCCCDFYELPLTARKSLVSKLLADGLAVTLPHRSAGTSLSVDLSGPKRLLRHPLYLQTLREFAASDP